MSEVISAAEIAFRIKTKNTVIESIICKCKNEVVISQIELNSVIMKSRGIVVRGVTGPCLVLTNSMSRGKGKHEQ